MAATCDRRNFLTSIVALAGSRCLPAVAAPAAIRMGYFDNYPPFSSIDAQGRMSGLLIDGVELVGHACGLSFEHHGYPWARAQLMVENGELDGLCTVANDKRKAYAEFCSTPIVSVRYGIFHRADDERARRIRSVADMRTFRQGSYRGAGYPLAHLEPDRIQWENTEASVLRKLDQDFLDIYVEGEIVTNPKIGELGLTKRIAFTPAPFLPQVDFCFALRRSHPDAAAIVAKMETAAAAARKSGALQALLAKYS